MDCRTSSGESYPKHLRRNRVCPVLLETLLKEKLEKVANSSLQSMVREHRSHSLLDLVKVARSLVKEMESVHHGGSLPEQRTLTARIDRISLAL
jgi:hypothetical protein